MRWAYSTALLNLHGAHCQTNQSTQALDGWTDRWMDGWMVRRVLWFYGLSYLLMMPVA